MSSFLSRASLISREMSASSQLNSAQLRIDSVLEGCTAQATDAGTLTAMIGGSFTFQAAQLAALSLSPSLSWFCRTSSYAAALGCEALSFTHLQRCFQNSGQSFAQDYTHSLLSLTSLKIFSRMSGQSLALQHLCGDLGMIASHRLANRMQLEPSSSSSFFEELAIAEGLTWQMKAGLRISHTFLPGLQAAEASLQRSSLIRRSYSLIPRHTEAALPTFSSQKTGRSNEYDGVNPKHPSKRAFFTGGVMGAVTRMEADNDEVTCRSTLREKLLNSLPPALRELINQHGNDYAVVFLTGMYNPLPDPAWMNSISAGFEKGGLVISTAPGRHNIRQQGLYSVLGDNVRVLQHFELEVPHVLQRLAFALQNPLLLAGVNRLVVTGHSKGGILAHALKTLMKAYFENSKSLPPAFYRLYPGLERIPPADLDLTMHVLRRSFYSALDWPVEGIPDMLLVRIIDRLMLEGIAHGFEENRMRNYFAETGLHPSEMDLAIETRMPGLRESLLDRSHPGNPLEAMAYRASGLFFYGVSRIMRAGGGDGLLRANQRHPGKVLRGRFNHLDVIVSPRAATEILELTFEELQRRSALAESPSHPG